MQKFINENAAIITALVAFLVVVGNQLFGFELTHELIIEVLAAFGLIIGVQAFSKSK